MKTVKFHRAMYKHSRYMGWKKASRLLFAEVQNWLRSSHLHSVEFDGVVYGEWPTSRHLFSDFVRAIDSHEKETKA